MDETTTPTGAAGIARHLADHYGYPPGTPVRSLRRLTNDAWAVEGERPAVLKVYGAGWRTPGEVRWEADLFEHLARRAVPAARVIRSRDGEPTTVIGIGGQRRPATLFAALPGRRLDGPFPPALYKREGHSVAALHAALDDFRSPAPRRALDLTTLVDEPLAAVLPLLPGGAERDSLVTAAATIRSRVAALAAAGLDTGPCHGDVTFDNVHLDDAGRFHWFDFDSGGPGPRAIDLQGWAALDSATRPLHDAFLAGYRTVRPLAPADVAAAPWLTLAQGAWSLWVDARRPGQDPAVRLATLRSAATALADAVDALDATPGPAQSPDR